MTTSTSRSLETTTTGPGAGTVVVSAPVEPEGRVIHGTLAVADRVRTYRLYLPSVLPDGPAPLFIGLHGGTGWGDQFATNNQVERLAESNGLIVVHPDGVTIDVGPKSIGGVDFPAPIEGFELFATRAGCPPPAVTRAGDVTTALRQPCTAGAAAAFVTIETGSHAWPGATTRVPSIVGEPYAAYDDDRTRRVPAVPSATLMPNVVSRM